MGTCFAVVFQFRSGNGGVTKKETGLVKLISFILVSLNIDIDGECMQPTRNGVLYLLELQSDPEASILSWLVIFVFLFDLHI